ncbi:MAG: universal stress protein [Rhodospirillales bacterium]|nr:universal stress protein [Rhodospirillales bacterium]
MAQIGHILVASDLTGRSVYPLQRAMQLKAESDCQLTVLHVVEHGFTSNIRERRHAEALTELESWKRSLPEVNQIGVTVNVMAGDPFATIVGMQQSHNVDLAIIGGPGKKGLKELFTGTTAERVVRFSNGPVLMVRQHAQGPYKRVLVAMDFSQGAKRALEWACRIAPDADIRLVHAWQSPLWGSTDDEEEKDAANRRLRDQEERQIGAVVREVAAARSLPLEVVDSDPHSAIRRTLGSFDAELLAIGTHSRSRLSTAIVGSFAREFLATGPCDVLVAKA